VVDSEDVHLGGPDKSIDDAVGRVDHLTQPGAWKLGNLSPRLGKSTQALGRNKNTSDRDISEMGGIL